MSTALTIPDARCVVATWVAGRRVRARTDGPVILMEVEGGGRRAWRQGPDMRVTEIPCDELPPIKWAFSEPAPWCRLPSVAP